MLKGRNLFLVLVAFGIGTTFQIIILTPESVLPNWSNLFETVKNRSDGYGVQQRPEKEAPAVLPSDLLIGDSLVGSTRDEMDFERQYLRSFPVDLFLTRKHEAKDRGRVIEDSASLKFPNLLDVR